MIDPHLEASVYNKDYPGATCIQTNVVQDGKERSSRQTLLRTNKGVHTKGVHTKGVHTKGVPTKVVNLFTHNNLNLKHANTIELLKLQEIIMFSR